MKNKFTIILSVVLSMILTTAINFSIPAVKGMKAFDPSATSLGTAFTYQGRLEKNSQLLDGVACSFQFGLYDVDAGGSPLGSGIQAVDLVLTKGFFTAVIDFGTAFNGDARWLEIATKCPGDADYTIIGRQPLTATPYALYAKAIPLAGSGSAETAARSDHNHWGQSWTGTGTGLSLNVTTGSTYGLYANSNYSDIALGGSSGDIFAGDSTTSRMRLYSNHNILLDLDNDNNSDSNFRILSGDDTDAFSVDETGMVQWKTQKGYLSIPAAAFNPVMDGYDYMVSIYDGVYTYNNSSEWYMTPVQLPDGCTITNVTYYWWDMDAVNNTDVTIYRGTLSSGAVATLISLTSSGAPGNGSSQSTSISNSTIDNSQYSYYIYSRVYISNHLLGVIIEYEYNGPH